MKNSVGADNIGHFLVSRWQWAATTGGTETGWVVNFASPCSSSSAFPPLHGSYPKTVGPARALAWRRGLCVARALVSVLPDLRSPSKC